MIKPDWNKFRAKFSENPQSNFEWFCYLLFCWEFKKPLGVSRYKNQSGIETNPIIKGNEVIGFQARFYGSTLSDHKHDLIKAIETSKKDCPDITKVIFYTNQEWGQGTNENDPKPKIEIEDKAGNLKITIEWRTTSFFESPFVSIENETIANHFFDLGKSTLDLLKERELHTENILYDISDNIVFNTQTLHIDRSSVLAAIQEHLDQNQILILSGVAGVGKTAVIKNFYMTMKSDVPFYVLKSTELNTNNMIHEAIRPAILAAWRLSG